MVKFYRFLKEEFRKELGFFAAMPAFVWQLLFLLLPSLLLLGKSLFLNEGMSLTLQNYLRCFNYNYFMATYNSLKLAYVTAFLSLLFCFPLVLMINFWVKKRFRTLFLFFLMMPSWTNFIIRIYSCFSLLRNDGIIVLGLKYLGLFAGESLITSKLVTYLVMVYCYFPFMLIPLNAAVSNINPRVFEASADLGASTWQTFWRVTVPMSLRGILFSLAMVVLSSFGEFTIPELIGGGKEIYWGNLVVSKILMLSDYHAGGAVLFVGMFSLMFSLLLAYLIFKLFIWLLSLIIDVPQQILDVHKIK